MRIYNRIRIKLHGKGLNGNLPFYCFIIQFFYSHSSQNAKQFIYKDLPVNNRAILQFHTLHRIHISRHSMLLEATFSSGIWRIDG